MFRHLVRHSLRRIVGPSVGGPGREQTGIDTRSAEGARAGMPAGEIDYWELLAEDFATHDRDVFEPGLWAVLVHRFGTRARSIDSPVLRTLCGAAYRTVSTAVDWGLGISLPRTVQLGRRVRLWHSGCMFLTARSIGNDVHIRQSTTFGPLHESDARPEALPVIEDGADIGSGTCILGAVTIGRQAVVGANSVVLENVPADANVLGVPARTVPVWSIGARSNAADGSTKDAGLPLSRGDRNLNPPGIGLVPLLAEDFRANGRTFLSAGFWAVAVHRFGNWRMGVRAKAVRAPLTLCYLAAYNGVIAIWGINLPYNGRVGRRLRIGGHGAVLMGAREIGDDVHVRSSVTMGLRRRTDPAAPTIGNRVQIEANACIIGNIHVGDDSVIGANTVLARDVLPASTVLGVPGRRINAAEYFQSAPLVHPTPSTQPIQAINMVKPVDGV
jgi:serine O-acetyltransferase